MRRFRFEAPTSSFDLARCEALLRSFMTLRISSDFASHAALFFAAIKSLTACGVLAYVLRRLVMVASIWSCVAVRHQVSIA